MNRRQLIAAASISAIVRPALAARPRAVTDKHLLVAGQSLALRWAWYPAAFDAFRETRAYMGDTSEWSLTVAAEGGSAMLRENFPPNFPDRYWWDRLAWTPGPTLIRSLAKIDGLTFTHAVWIQGQADAANYADLDWAALKYAYKHAYRAVSRHLFPSDLMYLNVLEVREPEPVGDQYIRTAHRALIAEGDALQGAEPNPDMVKVDGVHPSPVAGCADMGRRVALAIAV